MTLHLGALGDVSRETEDLLRQFVELIARWNKSINLLSSNDADQIWPRHIVDCAQLMEHAPENARTWIDIGSGGGLPGVVCAVIAQQLRPEINFTLVESDTRKCAFLREAARRLSIKIGVINQRIETVDLPPADIVSARALAPLPRLLDLAHRFCHSGTVHLYLKGQNADRELTLAQEDWHIISQSLPSRTDPRGVVLRLTEVSRKS